MKEWIPSSPLRFATETHAVSFVRPLEGLT